MRKLKHFIKMNYIEKLIREQKHIDKKAKINF